MHIYLGVCAALLVSTLGFHACAESDPEQSTTTIHNLDLTGAGPSGPNYILIILELKKLKAPSANGHIIFRQLNKRVRLETTGNSFPRGDYAVGVSSTCSGAKGSYTPLHDFKVETSYVSNEKALWKHGLREAKPGQTVLLGKNVLLFRVQGKSQSLITCQPIRD